MRRPGLLSVVGTARRWKQQPRRLGTGWLPGLQLRRRQGRMDPGMDERAGARQRGRRRPCGLGASQWQTHEGLQTIAQ